METDPIETFGGLSEARPATPEIQEIADKVRAQLEEKTNKKFEKYEAIEYKMQVVAGFNYFIKVDVGCGRYLHVNILSDFSGKNEDLVLNGYQDNKTKDDELTYF